MDAEQLKNKIENGESNFANIHLENQDLRAINLSQTNLKGAKLINCNLEEVYLRESNLQNIDLSGSNLSLANLEGSNLQGAIVNGTNFNETILFGADLTGVDISQAIDFPSTHILLADELNNPNAELVQTLRKLFYGLHNHHNTESSEPYDLFLWDSKLRGQFSLDLFLETTGLFVEVDTKSIFLYSSENPIQEYELIIDLLTSYLYLADYKFYSLNIDENLFEEGLLFLIGNTIYGDWIGVSTRVAHYDKYGAYPTRKRILDKASHKSENKVLKKTIDEQLNAIDIYDGDLDCFVWEIAETKEALVHNILINTHAMVATELESGFFGENSDLEDGYTPSWLKEIKSFSQKVRSSLTDIQVYLFSDGLVDVYIVGKDCNDNSIVIHNQLHQS